MKFSHEWLRQYVSIAEEPARVGERLTAAGFPLDGLEGSGDAAVYDFDIFPNRPDCMSHLGLGREYAALTGAPLRRPETRLATGGRPTTALAAVVIEAPDLCARYAARCVTGARVGPSPAWLRRRLESIGARPINNVVDATNFVLWETGQPLHPFDLDLLEGRRIVVRRAVAGETLRTLDGVERRLTADMLVIADARRPVALAGVMGGEATEIREATREILLESAWFDPVSVRRTSRTLGLRTEASQRFERGSDPGAVVSALDRAAALIAEVAGGSVSDPALDVHPRREEPRSLHLRPARAGRLLGTAIGEPVMRQALERREFRVEPASDAQWTVSVPSFRRDIEREADLIEEIARHAGYDVIPTRLPLLDVRPPGRGRIEAGTRALRRALQAAGLSEAINYAMAEPGECRLFSESVPTALDNPLQAHASHLRTSLLPGLLRNTTHNLNHGLPGCHLFEIGAVFRRGDGRTHEDLRVALVLAGRAPGSHWSAARREVDLYDARGAVELLGDLLGIPLDFASDTIRWLAPGTALGVRAGGRPAGGLGMLADEVRRRYGIEAPVFAAEIEAGTVLAAAGGERRFAPLPRHPAVRRDLALVVPLGTPYRAIERRIRDAGDLPIVEVAPFDRYRGAGVPDGCVGLAVQVVFQHPERTLTAEEVQRAQDAIVAALARDLGVRLRGGAEEEGR
jgi:phenylalanyl-tRNA synthetase beta chain